MEMVDLRSIAGPRMVTIWAQWCPPCRAELPILANAATFLREHDITAVGIIYKDPRPEQSRKLARETGWGARQLLDENGELDFILSIPAPPQTLAIDGDNVIVATKVGAFSSDDELRSFVTENLNGHT